jgi:hypothetical protein
MKLFTDISGVVEDTIVITCSDIVQNFTTAQLQNANGVLPIGCLVTAEGNDVRFAFDTDPTQGIDGSGALGHVLYAGQSYLITNTRNVQTFRFINHTNGQDAIIQASMMYEIGA